MFGWLFYRINTAILDSLDSWQPEDAPLATRALLYVIADLCSAACAAELLWRPIRRTFGGAAVPAALLIATPWLILASLDTAFDPVRRLAHPSNNASWLFEAILPTSILMLRCERISAPDPAPSALLVSTLGGHAPLRWLAPATVIVAPVDRLAAVQCINDPRPIDSTGGRRLATPPDCTSQTMSWNTLLQDGGRGQFDTLNWGFSDAR